MSKSFKFKNNMHLDSTGIVHNKELLSNVLNNGLMSSSDKEKLNGIANGATNIAKIIFKNAVVQGPVNLDVTNYSKGIFIFLFKADGTTQHSCHIMSFSRHSSTASSSMQLVYNTENTTFINTTVTYSSTNNMFTFKMGVWGGRLDVFYIGI